MGDLLGMFHIYGDLPFSWLILFLIACMVKQRLRLVFFSTKRSRNNTDEKDGVE